MLYLYSAISLQPNSALQQSQFEKYNNTNSITVKNIFKKLFKMLKLYRKIKAI